MKLMDSRTSEFSIVLSLLLAAMPFYMFSVAFGRDWPALWCSVLLMFVFIVRFFRSGGYMWIDRSMLYLAMFVAVYVFSSWLLSLQDPTHRLLGRTETDRAWSIATRMFYVALFFVVVTNVIAGLSDSGLRNLFVVQMLVGASIALFGILQYVSYYGLGMRDFIEIAPTNDSFELYSSFIGKGAERSFRSAAVFHEPSAFGFFLVPLVVKSFVAFVSGTIIVSRGFHLALTFLLVVAVVVNFSMTAVFALIIVSTLFLLSQVRVSTSALQTAVLLGTIVFAVLAAPLGARITQRLVSVVALTDVSTLDRILRAFMGTVVFLESPWTGMGPGFFAFLYPKLTGLTVDGFASPLNIWLFFLTDVGLIGIVPFIAMLVSIGMRGRRLSRHVPLVRTYLWSVLSLLILLSTVDSWYLEFLWFELALLLVLISRGKIAHDSAPRRSPVVAIGKGVEAGLA